MPTIKYKPTTPSRRNMSVPAYKQIITKDTPEKSLVVIKSCANIPGVVTAQYNNLNVYDILNANKFVVTAAAVKMLEEVYA